MTKPLTILGGGIAGLSLAVALSRRGVRVVLHEASTYPRHRVCGEFINGVSDQTLSELGVLDLLHDAVRHRKTVWRLGEARILQQELPEPARGISRYELDNRMRLRFQQAGGELRQSSRAAPCHGEGEIDATGRKTAKSSPWLGLKVHLSNLPGLEGLEMHLGTNGYVGLAGIENGRVNVCALFRRQPHIKGRGPGLLLAYLRKGGLCHLAALIEAADHDPRSWLGVSALTFGSQQPVSGLSGQVRIGDADCIIPPFTGNGMSMAFESADCAVEPLLRYASGEQSWSEVVGAIRTATRRRFLLRLSASRILHPFLHRPGGQRILQAMAQSGLLPFHTLARLLR